MITDVEGVEVGQWTDAAARTGCTVVCFPEGTVASGEVRGGAPATREFALLDPSRMIQRIDAVVLTGGSAFGLASAHGVMEVLAERGRGFETAGGVVPIVVAMGIFDLAVGDGTVRPGADQGRLATESASSGPHEVGLVGAGTGATVAKWRGVDHRRPGGLVTRTVRGDDGLVRLTLPLTHEHLAALIGAARETTTLTLSDLRRRGFVEGTRGRYRFDPARLRDAAHGPLLN